EDFEELFDKLATRLIATGEKVILKGHTDSHGDSELNFTIALRNAKDIRDVLKEKGVPEGQIETTSRGEDEPVGDNTTDIGKFDNRRIEIDIREG
ncbi:MAG: OmpA family protein, partial [Saprospiraceae bacterium]